jgi:ketosteroid isomerase-like protein
MPVVGEGNTERLRKLYERWERGDLASAEFFDLEVEYARFGADLADLSGEWRGFEQVRAAQAEYLRAFEDWRLKAERVIDLGDDRVLVLDRQTARGKSSGVVLEHELGSLFTLRDGKVVRWEHYWDRAQAVRAAGLEA